ncbi:AIPR family protein [Herbiconiux sp. CPCC 205716]|uniref:AIPR family protein n=1 Tax=Herbiconiux gentiana TaxID=2970912 RepID=A0ABT2GF54_9MICO|nr:AIPR family protein [Herbiconiux gentiana]MCS5713524.1 AIPR family protein [Herbiconiux gentiana]
MSFEDDLRDSIAIRAEGSSSFRIQAFAEELAERLEVAEVVFDVSVESLRCTGRNRRNLELLGYAEDPADDSLVILVGSYFDSPGAVLNMTEAKRVFGAGAGFLEQSADGWLGDNLEISSKEAEYSIYFKKHFSRFERIKFILITDATMSSTIKAIPSDEVAGKPASYSIWDLRRFEELANSDSGRDDIHVDLTTWLPDGLPCLEGAESGQHARSYLAVLPGRLLADVFREYGSQLLESNVRTFLSARGKVNKGIQYTLAQEPDMFLAYNNGLTTTATGVTLERRGGAAFITAIDNWQIVNGGQTTSSLAYFMRQAKDRSLDGVFVQMKLVTVEPDQAADLVSKVSRFANSQNKVSEADFFSNSPFHVRLEQISLRLKAPALEGMQFGTGWFYERTRGQYENTRNARTASEQKRFDLEFPKSQKIMKTDWAKYAFAWGKRPHDVSKGAQSNFMAYAVEADAIWDNNDQAINDAYFRTNVAKVIMFNQLRAAVMKSPWYGTGYLANIVAYAMSKFAFEIEAQFPSSRFDFDAVWNRQSLSAETEEVLLEIANLMQKVLTDPGRPQSNVTQWAKQVACWDSAKDSPFVLPRGIEVDLVSRSDEKTAQVAARRERQVDSGFEAIGRVLKVKPDVWSTVLREGVRGGLISPTERGIIERIAVPGTVPTERQAARALLALERSAENALISHDAY